MKRALAASLAVAASFTTPTTAAADEPTVTAGGATPIFAIDADGDRVVFDSVSRNLDPLVDARTPAGTYRWTPTSLGRVEQVGSLALDITPDGRTAVMIDRPNGFSPTRQARVFDVDADTGLETVSVSSSGEEANGNVFAGVSISADARYVAFASAATNLDGPAQGIFLRDRRRHTTTRVATIGTNGGFPSLSDDASAIAYMDADLHVYVRDLPDGDRELVTPRGFGPQLSADGDVVAYTQYADGPGPSQVVALDRTTGDEVRIPDAFQPSISADGRRIAYVVMRNAGTSEQTLAQVWVRDLRSGETTLVSRTPDGREARPGSLDPRISGDGTTVAFQSAAVDLVPGLVTAPTEDLYLADLDTGAVTPLTVARDAGLHHLRTDGFVNSYGAAQPRTPQPRFDDAVAIAEPTFHDGFWVANAAGRVARAGFAQHLGEITTPLARPIVDLASSRSGRGYWLVASDGGVFSFGDARFHGSTGAIRLNQPIVGMAPTPSGNGYWLVASDGGVFSFGDARFHGSTGAIRLNQPIVGMARTPSGDGYWLVARDGGIFAFGDAPYLGSTGAIRLNQPIVAMVRTHTGRGYRLVARDGGVFAFGDASHVWGPSDPGCGAVCIVDATGA